MNVTSTSLSDMTVSGVSRSVLTSGASPRTRAVSPTSSSSPESNHTISLAVPVPPQAADFRRNKQLQTPPTSGRVSEKSPPNVDDIAKNLLAQRDLTDSAKTKPARGQTADQDDAVERVNSQSPSRDTTHSGLGAEMVKNDIEVDDERAASILLNIRNAKVETCTDWFGCIKAAQVLISMKRAPDDLYVRKPILDDPETDPETEDEGGIDIVHEGKHLGTARLPGKGDARRAILKARGIPYQDNRDGNGGASTYTLRGHYSPHDFTVAGLNEFRGRWKEEIKQAPKGKDQLLRGPGPDIFVRSPTSDDEETEDESEAPSHTHLAPPARDDRTGRMQESKSKSKIKSKSKSKKPEAAAATPTVAETPASASQPPKKQQRIKLKVDPLKVQAEQAESRKRKADTDIASSGSAVNESSTPPSKRQRTSTIPAPAPAPTPAPAPAPAPTPARARAPTPARARARAPAPTPAASGPIRIGALLAAHPISDATRASIDRTTAVIRAERAAHFAAAGSGTGTGSAAAAAAPTRSRAPPRASAPAGASPPTSTRVSARVAARGTAATSDAAPAPAPAPGSGSGFGCASGSATASASASVPVPASASVPVPASASVPVPASASAPASTTTSKSTSTSTPPSTRSKRQRKPTSKLQHSISAEDL